MDLFVVVYRLLYCSHGTLGTVKRMEGRMSILVVLAGKIKRQCISSRYFAANHRQFKLT